MLSLIAIYDHHPEFWSELDKSSKVCIRRFLSYFKPLLTYEISSLDSRIKLRNIFSLELNQKLPNILYLIWVLSSNLLYGPKPKLGTMRSLDWYVTNFQKRDKGSFPSRPRNLYTSTHPNLFTCAILCSSRTNK